MPEVKTPLPHLIDVDGDHIFYIKSHHSLKDVLRWVVEQSDIQEFTTLAEQIMEEEGDKIG